MREDELTLENAYAIIRGWDKNTEHITEEIKAAAIVVFNSITPEMWEEDYTSLNHGSGI